MSKSRYKLAKERREARHAIEREKDTIYYLDFIPKDGKPTERTTLLDDPWCVRLPRNPENKPELIDDAIRTFEKKHEVEFWSDVASEYKVGALWYP